MGWREKPTVNARNGFLQVFIKQISESRGGEGGGGGGALRPGETFWVVETSL